MDDKLLNFVQPNSPDGGFLQSEHWRVFQEAWGRKAHNVSASGDDGELIAFANIIEHILPIAGKYFYIPRGPVIEKSQIQNPNVKQNPKSQCQIFFGDLFGLARKNNVGWIRIEPASCDILEFLRSNLKNLKIKKSFVDIQPKEILVLDISKSEEDLLAEMKQKTRYNIKLSQKRGVSVKVISKKYIEEFIKLVKITSERDKITAHPENYYRKMFETIPGDILKLYVAEYEGKIIAANLILFFGKTATYMHGASDNEHRNLMAPYLLQWQAIKDAKEAGCERYDFGGVKTKPHPSPLLDKEMGNSWSGITKFKTGFAPETQSTQFPGCYDIILKPAKYNLYRALQKIKKIF